VRNAISIIDILKMPGKFVIFQKKIAYSDNSDLLGNSFYFNGKSN
jgi:hypothetical protein